MAVAGEGRYTGDEGESATGTRAKPRGETLAECVAHSPSALTPHWRSGMMGRRRHLHVVIGAWALAPDCLGSDPSSGTCLCVSQVSDLKKGDANRAWYGD